MTGRLQVRYPAGVAAEVFRQSLKIKKLTKLTGSVLKIDQNRWNPHHVTPCLSSTVSMFHCVYFPSLTSGFCVSLMWDLVVCGRQDWMGQVETGLGLLR